MAERARYGGDAGGDGWWEVRGAWDGSRSETSARVACGGGGWERAGAGLGASRSYDRGRGEAGEEAVGGVGGGWRWGCQHLAMGVRVGGAGRSLTVQEENVTG